MRSTIHRLDALAFAFLLVLLSGTAASAQTPNAAWRGLKTQQWQQDLQYLAKELPRRHKNAFHTVSRDQFERAVAELNSRLPTLEPHEVIAGMMRIVAMVSDAHTQLSGFGSDFHAFPLNVYWFGDELRVTRIAENYRRAVGARVLQIDGVNIKEANSRMSQLVAHENDYWVRQLSAAYMPYAEILHALKITPDTKQARWTFVASDGEQFSLAMNAISPNEKVEWLSASDSSPLYRQQPDQQFWFTYLTDSQTIYVNFRGYRDEFTRHAGDLLSFIKQNPTRRLIIDVRQNRGGDFTKVRRELIPGLKQAGVFSKPGSLFIITGRATQSAAVVNAVDFRKEMHAILVGEPTGGRPNGYSEHGEFMLPSSNLKISYSSRYYKFQDQDTPAVMPDKLIETSWEAYQAGRDPVMEWILSQPPGK